MLKAILPLPSEAKVVLDRDAECSAYNGTVVSVILYAKNGEAKKFKKGHTLD